MIKDSDLKDLLDRGVDEVIDRKHLESRLRKGDNLRVKLGIDPTSPDIHIGRAVQLRKLATFQKHGHKAVFIVGDFTGLIGDTSDKESERPMLSPEQIKINMKTYLDQAFKILDPKKTEVHHNSTWLTGLGFGDIGRMADLFGLHEFETREVISRRLKTGKRVSLREILYPLMQGYDSVAVKADVELGGTDQRFNLLAGRTIQPLYKQEPQDILMASLLEGTDGRKMSSSWGNVIKLTDEPSDMFGKVMSIKDSLIINYFKLATDVSLEEIGSLELQLQRGANPKDIKTRLAEEITSFHHSSKAAKKAKEEFEKVFSKRELPTEIPEWKIEGGSNIVDALVNSGLAKSKSEAKRLIEQGGVSVNEKPVKDWDAEIKRGDIIKFGSRKFLRIK